MNHAKSWWGNDSCKVMVGGNDSCKVMVGVMNHAYMILI